jgi:hypothetical protein
MSYQSAELKLRNLAAANTQLIADLTWPNTAGNATFMWMDRQLTQGDLGKPSDGRACVTVRRVSSLRPADNQGGVGNLSQPRIQINIVTYNAEQGRLIAKHMVDFFNTISLCNAGYFASPVTGPNQNPNCLLNERAGLLPQLAPPAEVWTQDWRVFNVESVPS